MTRVILLMVVLASVAKADFIKKSEFNLVCDKGFKLIADGKTSSIYLNQELVHQDKSSTAGTEGGAPYQQLVGGGFNITLEGKEFSQAFAEESGTSRNVKMTVSVNDYKNNDFFEIQCSGELKFSPLF